MRWTEPEPGVMRVPLLILACLAGLACAERAADEAPAAADSAVVSSPPGEAGLDPVARFLARVPPETFTRRGACPFECCIYREWYADSDIPVRARERGTDPSVFTIRAGDRFRADSGNVHIRDVLLIAVHDSVGDPPYWSFGPGDTLVVLDYVGEGRYHLWQDGRVVEAEGFWGAERLPLVAEMIGRWASEWWVHVTLPDGRQGWFDASPPVRLRGADACASPD